MGPEAGALGRRSGSREACTMSFEWPMALWLLLAVPGLVAAYLWLKRRRKKIALRYASLAVVREALGRAPGWRF